MTQAEAEVASPQRTVTNPAPVFTQAASRCHPSQDDRLYRTRL